MRAFILPLITLGALALAGCEEQVACTDLLAFSVSLELEDADGVAVDDATVTYTVDGGSATSCENFENGSYACGMEEEGAITVDIEWQGATESLDFEIEADECHVIGETATVVLEP